MFQVLFSDEAEVVLVGLLGAHLGRQLILEDFEFVGFGGARLGSKDFFDYLVIFDDFLRPYPSQFFVTLLVAVLFAEP